MPQNNPKQEAELREYIMARFGMEPREDWYDSYRYDDRKQLIEFINTHTTKLLNEQLGRLSEQSVYGHLAVPDCTQFIPLTAIENERKKLKESSND